VQTPDPPAGRRSGRLARLIARVEDGFLIALLAAMIGIAGIQILLRNVFDSGITWAEPLARLLVLWVGLAGAIVATRQNDLIAINLVLRFLSDRQQLGARVFTNVFTFAVSGLVAYHAGRFVAGEYAAGTLVFASVPAWVGELILPLGFGAIALRCLVAGVLQVRELATHRREEA
jgi:TRAP-type C4-dicarboxylate transport system permease small subunit